MSEPAEVSNDGVGESKHLLGATQVGMMPELRYAGFWIRAAASLIDTVLLLAITAPLLMLFYGADALSADAQPAGLAATLINYVLPAIAVIAFWIFKSATPGKMLLGLRIVDAQTGGIPSKGQLIGRYFAYYVSMIPLMAGFIWVAFDKRKQGFHDKLAKTLVIRGTEAKQASPDGPSVSYSETEPHSERDSQTDTTGASEMKHDKYHRRHVPSVERMRK